MIEGASQCTFGRLIVSFPDLLMAEIFVGSLCPSSDDRTDCSVGSSGCLILFLLIEPLASNNGSDCAGCSAESLEMSLSGYG